MTLTTIEVISDPMRRQILRQVWEQEVQVGELVEKFDVSQPAISFHLKAMRESGHVRFRQEGRKRLYRANQKAFGGMRAYLETYWKERLSILKDEAELEARRRSRGR